MPDNLDQQLAELVLEQKLEHATNTDSELDTPDGTHWGYHSHRLGYALGQNAAGDTSPPMIMAVIAAFPLPNPTQQPPTGEILHVFFTPYEAADFGLALAKHAMQIGRGDDDD